jgi:hypothetical protein
VPPRRPGTGDFGEAVKILAKGSKLENAPIDNQELASTSFCGFRFFHSFGESALSWGITPGSALLIECGICKEVW